MNNWTESELACLDFETTGVDPATARVVEIGLVVLSAAGDVIHSDRTLVDPGIEIPAEATAVHGISTAQAKAEGVDAAVAVAQLCDTLRVECVEVPRPLVIFNARYDWALLAAEAARFGLIVPQVDLLDPMVIDRAVDKWRKGKRQLGDVADAYGVALDGAHTAIADATAAGRVMQAISLKHTEKVGALSAVELVAAQRDWFRTWRDDFNKFLEGKGADWRVEGEWPS